MYDVSTQDPNNRPAPWNGFAITSFVLAFVPFGGILSIIFGHIALGQIKKTGEQGHGLALAGTIIGYVAIAIAILVIVLIVAAAASTPVPATGFGA